MQETLPLPVTMGEPIEVVLPFLPKSRNQIAGMPWLHARSYGEKWARHVDKALVGIGPFQIVEVELEYVFTSKRTRDWQNYLGPIHVVANAMVRAGVIPDDSPEFFRTGANSGIVFAVDSNGLIPAKDRQKTILRITPIEE